MSRQITCRAYARVGLLGNPSDGYYGKTIALTIENYYAEVTLVPSTSIRFEPHPLHDSSEFPSLTHLSERIQRNGYYGGIRLLWATCYRFSEYWKSKGSPLEDKPFTLSYDTNIPKQAGLSGSSAIITACMSCLEAHFDRYIPKEVRPNVVLEAEKELGITAGLMDRVIQTFEGVVSMDFGQEHMRVKGYGLYTRIDPELIPTLWLIWGDNPGDSGKVHAPIRKLWDEGDPRTRQLIGECSSLVPKGIDALNKKDYKAFGDLMNRNFDIRRALFGDAALGKTNVTMVEVARSVGAAAKFTGSGGAVVALCKDPEQEAALAAACKAAGLNCEEVRIHRGVGGETAAV